MPSAIKEKKKKTFHAVGMTVRTPGFSTSLEFIDTA